MAGSRMTDWLGSGTQVVGDDLFVTNLAILQRGSKGVANSILPVICNWIKWTWRVGCYMLDD